MDFSNCQTPDDALAFTSEYEERENVKHSLSYAFAMSGEKIRRRKRLQNRAKDRQKKFAFSLSR